MVRELLRELGMVKTLLVITLLTVLSSVLIYTTAAILFGGMATIGMVLSAAVPAILAPSISYFLLRVLVRLDLAEQALIRVNTELELRVKQRTAELVQANEELQAEVFQRKQAEGALQRYATELEQKNQELQQFAHIASHDLQEPLRMVTSYLQLLERRYKGQLGPDADEFIAFAVAGAARMHALIKDLLTYSRVGTRGRPFELTDCQTVLGQVLANLRVALEESGATVSYDPLPTVTADATQLSQLFQNLIGNAVKFRSGQLPEIHVGAARQDGEWLFSVRDNGIGIEPQYAERVFVIFQRLHMQDEYPGTGIGLAICKRIVERHGGRIWVESEPGQGSTFYFTIPEGM